MTITCGAWRAKAISADFGRTAKSSEQVAVLLEFLDGPNQSQRITWYGYFTEKTADRTLESLMIAGWDGDDLYELVGLGTTDFEAVVEEDTYEGKTRTKVQWINRMYGNTPAMKQKLNDGEKRAFAERMKGRALALKQNQPAPPAADAGDDLPF